jgi:hypothetical protein
MNGHQCKSCGSALDNFEVRNKPALGGNCVNCKVSPKQQDQDRQVNDMSMSPFTSIQRIQRHLTAAHGMGEGDVNEAITRMSHSHGIEDIHHSTNQHTWRGLHSAAHEAEGVDHDPASTHTSDDPFDIFNDRRS